jgi:hypothetical protein
MQNSSDGIDLESAKESALMSAKAVSNTLSDHTYKIKPHQQQQPQHESQLNRQDQARKRTKPNNTTTTDNSSSDEDKSKRKLRKPNEPIPVKVNGVIGSSVADQITDFSYTIKIEDEVTFVPGEFLIHKSTFSDVENYDIWCVRDDGYLQKYEPVYLSTGERCHQSADILAQYTPDKNEFVLVKCEEKGKTEQNNIVVCVINEYEPKNMTFFQQLKQQDTEPIQEHSETPIKSVDSYDDLKPTFDVFLQILLSQSINSEFLCKIKEIQGFQFFSFELTLNSTDFQFFFQPRRLFQTGNGVDRHDFHRKIFVDQ